MTKKEKMIRQTIESQGITSTTECFVKYRAFPGFTKKVVLSMMEEGYNISMRHDHIDMSFYWLDCEKNVIFPRKRTLN